MSFDAHLIHICTIENPIAGGTNAYNNTVKAFAVPVTGVHCRLVEDHETVQADEVSEGYVKTMYKLLVHGNVDLQEKARISSVTLEDGTVINDTFEVVDLLARRGRSSHHMTATLERIS